METEAYSKTISLGDLFRVFFKAGMAFGGGLGILAVLEDELVSKRKILSREDFLTTYGIGRVIPSGTMTALAVAFGYRFGGLPGTIISLIALVLPAFILTVILAAAYLYLKDGPLLEVLPVTILPAALAFIVTAAIKLGKDVFRPSPDLLLAAGALAGSAMFDINPALLLVAGGLLGLLIFRTDKERAQ